MSEALAWPGANALSNINLATALSRLAKALGAGAGRAQQEAADGSGVRAAGERVAGAVWGEAVERLRVAPREFEARQIATLFWSLSKYALPPLSPEDAGTQEATLGVLSQDTYGSGINLPTVPHTQGASNNGGC